MSFNKVFYEALDKSKEGRNKGLEFPIDALNQAFGGIIQESYILWVAESNVGKTRILYYLYVIHVLNHLLDENTSRTLDDVKIVIYAYEMTLEKTLAIIAANYLNKVKGLNYSDTDIAGYKEKPPKELVDALESEDFKEYLKNLDKILEFRTTKNIKKLISEVAQDCRAISTKVEIDKPVIYKFNNPKQLYIVLLDHVGNIISTDGDFDRQAIMKLSKGLLSLRNMFGITAVPIQQANPGYDGPKLYPDQASLRDSKDTFIDADGVASIASPYKLNIDKVSFQGKYYYILPTPENNYRGLMNTFRMLSILKTRFGELIKKIPVLFNGASSFIVDAPLPEDVKYKNQF